MNLKVDAENPVVAHENETEAMETMFATVAGMATSFSNDYVAAAYVWSKNAQATAWSRFQEANPNAYVWTGCTLDKAIELWAEYAEVLTDGDFGTYKYEAITSPSTPNKEGTEYAVKLANWIVAVMNGNNTGFVKNAQDAITNLGLDKVAEITTLKKYTNAQVNALDGTLTVTD